VTLCVDAAAARDYPDKVEIEIHFQNQKRMFP